MTAKRAILRFTAGTLTAAILITSLIIWNDTSLVITSETQHPSFNPVDEDPNLPRILILGDSISIGYTLPVRRLLKGQANVIRPAENCESTNKGIARIDDWLANGHWDVIHFNWGLHDIKFTNADGEDRANPALPTSYRQVSTERYRQNLIKLVERLRITQAQLIFATTTPVPALAKGRISSDEVLYNSIAVSVMREYNIPVNNLYRAVTQASDNLQLESDVHFTDQGYEFLGDQVALHIMGALADRQRVRLNESPLASAGQATLTN